MSILQAKEPNGWPLEKIFANNHAVEWVRGVYDVDVPKCSGRKTSHSVRRQAN